MKITIPRAQTLRFVKTTNYLSEPYNHDNRLLQDEGRIYDEPIVYFQKFSTNDPILIYLITDYPTIICNIYDCSNVLKETISLSDVGANLTDATAYYGIVNTATYGGIYYAKLTFTGVGLTTYEYTSEYFEVDNFSTLPYIKWKDNDYAGIYYENGVIEFGFRIDADITGYTGKLDTETFEAFNSTIVNVRSKIKRVINFKTDEIPRYIYEKLILAFGHNYLEINGIEYIPIDSPSDEPVDATQFYFFVCNLAQAEYEVYDEILDATGGTPSGDEGILSTDGIDVMSTNGTDLVKIY